MWERLGNSYKNYFEFEFFEIESNRRKKVQTIKVFK